MQAAGFMAAYVVYGAAFKIGLATFSKCDGSSADGIGGVVRAMPSPQNYGVVAN
jgi:hypothetical protein